MHLAPFTFCFALILSEISCQIPRPPIIDKLFNRPQESVSQFPPIIEFFVQKIQAQYSNYVHEDLSRPQTWNKPVYTLSPADQVFFSSTPNNSSTFHIKENNLENVDADNSTEIFFELIFNNNDKVHNNGDESTELFFETIKTSSASPENATVVYITPKKTYSTTPTANETND